MVQPGLRRSRAAAETDDGARARCRCRRGGGAIEERGPAAVGVKGRGGGEPLGVVVPLATATQHLPESVAIVPPPHRCLCPPRLCRREELAVRRHEPREAVVERGHGVGALLVEEAAKVRAVRPALLREERDGSQLARRGRQRLLCRSSGASARDVQRIGRGLGQSGLSERSGKGLCGSERLPRKARSRRRARLHGEEPRAGVRLCPGRRLCRQHLCLCARADRAAPRSGGGDCRGR